MPLQQTKGTDVVGDAIQETVPWKWRLHRTLKTAPCSYLHGEKTTHKVEAKLEQVGWTEYQGEGCLLRIALQEFVIEGSQMHTSRSLWSQWPIRSRTTRVLSRSYRLWWQGQATAGTLGVDLNNT